MSITFYGKRLLNELSVTKGLSDIFYGIVEPHEVTLEFDNADGHFSALQAAGEEFRNRGVRLRIYEPLETQPVTFLLYGKIIDADILARAKFTIAVYDPDPLNTVIPKKVYETTDWAENPPNTVNPAGDLGKPYNIVFGHTKKVPCLYVHADYDLDYYDYIIGYGTLNACDYVYRDKKLVNPAEYTFYDGSQASPYPGYAFIRFVVPQRDLSGRYYEITADVKGLELSGSTAERNFARIIQYLLSNATWGLGLTVNTVSFDTAAIQVEELLADGCITDQKKAIDYLQELLLLCRGKLDYNEAGELAIIIDAYNAKVSCAFGHKDTADRYENICEITENRKTSIREALKSFELNYGYDTWEGKYSYKNKRTIFSFGQEKIVDTLFVRDHVTADKITSYQKNLQVYCDRKLTVAIGKEARNLNEGDITRVIYPDLGIDGNYQIRGIVRGLNNFTFRLNSYSADIYQYIPGDMPGDANDDTEPDYTNTNPAAPTAFSKTGQDSEQTTDGTTLAWMTFQATAPSVNYSRLLFGYKRTGSASYTFLEGTAPETGYVWTIRIEGLLPGKLYDFIVIAVNVYGLKSEINPTLTSQLAPGDSTAPAAPTGLSAAQGIGKVTLTWTANTEDDLAGYWIYRGGVKIAELGLLTKWADTNISYGVSYTYYLKAVDNTGNQSPASSSVSQSAKQVQTGDVGDSQITNSKILSCAWAKITDAIITNAQIENLDANKINVGIISSCILRVADGSVCYSSFGGDISGNRTGLAHWYTTAGVEIAKIGYSTDHGTYVGHFKGDAATYGGVYARSGSYSFPAVKGKTLMGNAGVVGTSGSGAAVLDTVPAGVAGSTGTGGYGVLGYSSGGYAGFFMGKLGLDLIATSLSATAGSASLPANPAGFMTVNINGTDVKIPYYY